MPHNFIPNPPNCTRHPWRNIQSLSWRSVALASPHLWARLHVGFSDAYRSPKTPKQLENNMLESEEEVQNRLSKASQTLELRCHGVEDWLARSASCPLSLSIYYNRQPSRSNERTTEPSFEYWDLTHRLFTTIISSSERWRTIELKMPFGMLLKFDAMIQKSSIVLPALRSLKTQVTYIAEGLNNWSGTMTLFSASNLQQLSLAYRYPSSFLTATQLNSYAARGQHITHLNWHFPLPVIHAFNLLRSLGNLVYCQIRFDSAEPTTALRNSGNVFNTPAVLPHLLAFFIDDFCDDRHLVTDFYSSIEAPKLNGFNIGKMKAGKLIMKVCYRPPFLHFF
ncbi:hypothetical protein CPB84DRAFT_174432 [Gymnopilus junonius]|uniref:Uncharacterized protein n=1 Tax=Gymnopilus junonius TaxID=109634 RepID=A0A9P5NG49_GYMJU|nr:hypothetical protein CPB84DRAFT_174432 [Gymnopilus junonius]